MHDLWVNLNTQERTETAKEYLHLDLPEFGYAVFQAVNDYSIKLLIYDLKGEDHELYTQPDLTLFFAFKRSIVRPLAIPPTPQLFQPIRQSLYTK